VLGAEFQFQLFPRGPVKKKKKKKSDVGVSGK
jgi:hypothetical protein